MRCMIILAMLLLPVLSFSAPAEKLTFVCDNYPPYEYDENGKPAGIVTNVVQEACRRMGMESEITVVPWKRAIAYVKKGKADGIFALFRTQEREKFLFYPGIGVCDEKIVIVARKDRRLKVSGPDDLKNLRVGVVIENSYGKEFDSYRNLNKQIANNDTNLVTLLHKKRIDVAVISELVFKYIVKTLNLKLNEFETLDYSPTSEPLFVAFGKAKGKKGKELAGRFETILNSMKEDGTIRRITQEVLAPKDLLGKRIILATSNWEPMYGDSLPEGGVFTAITREAFKRGGYEFHIKFVPWQRAFDSAAKGIYDGLMGAIATSDRRRLFSETIKIMPYNGMLFGRTGEIVSFTHLKDLKAYKIGTIRGSAISHKLKTAGILVEEVSEYGQNLEKLVRKRIDLMEGDNLVVPQLIKKHPKYNGKIKSIAKPILVSNLANLISKTHPDHLEIVSVFNVEFQEMVNDGTVDAIVTRFGFSKLH